MCEPFDFFEYISIFFFFYVKFPVIMGVFFLKAFPWLLLLHTFEGFLIFFKKEK